MSAVKNVRDVYAENTRQTLLDTGRRLFAERDYATLSAEELVRSAGLTRGALYHHFDGKRGLFEAVLDEAERCAAQRIRAAISTTSDPMQRIVRGIAEFLDICADPGYQRIVLLEGPAALGWRRWRELDHTHLGSMVVEEMQALLDAGLIEPYPADLVAGAIYGALTELSLTIADAGGRAHPQATDLIHHLLMGLARQKGPVRP